MRFSLCFGVICRNQQFYKIIKIWSWNSLFSTNSRNLLNQYYELYSVMNYLNNISLIENRVAGYLAASWWTIESDVSSKRTWDLNGDYVPCAHNAPTSKIRLYYANVNARLPLFLSFRQPVGMGWWVKGVKGAGGIEFNGTMFNPKNKSIKVEELKLFWRIYNTPSK